MRPALAIGPTGSRLVDTGPPKSRWRAAVALALGAVMAMPLGTGTSAATAADPSVSTWVRHRATPLQTTQPAAPLNDMGPLRHSMRGATVVGLGESVHGASELLGLKHRTVRLLVERLGFRTVAWEEDWSTGLRIDRYLRTGAGDARGLTREMSPQWDSRQVAGTLSWLREYNVGHPADQVRFFGVEYYFTRPLVYDAVRRYVTQVAPRQLARLGPLLRALRPIDDNSFAHIAWYTKRLDKARYIRRAHAVLEIVRRLAGRDTRQGRIAIHHARQIVSFYEHYALPADAANRYRERRAAQNLAWWQRLTGHKVAYWAAGAHTAAAPRLRLVQGDGTTMRFASAGSYLRRRYATRYLSVGYTFDHGRVGLGSDATALRSPPRRSWFERPLGTVELAQFAIDLRHGGPPSVQQWLHRPVIARGVSDDDGYAAGGSLAQWYDVIVHRQSVTPAS